jgi:hypothetical protein
MSGHSGSADVLSRHSGRAALSSEDARWDRVPVASQAFDASEVTDGMADREHIQHLLRLVEKLEREAKHVSRTCGKRELNVLEATAEQYLKLYRDLKARGEIE